MDNNEELKNIIALERKRIVEQCPKCKGKGIVYPVGVPFGTPCGCELEHLLRERVIMNIKREFWNLDLNDFKDKTIKAYEYTKTYIDNLQSFKNDNRWVYFEGGARTGKTLLAASILKEAIRKRYSVNMYTVNSIISAVQSYDEDFKEDFLSRDFIVIDSLDLIFKGSREQMIRVSGMLEPLLNERSLNAKICIFTCKNSLEDMAKEERLSTSICDLIGSRAIPIKVEGEGIKNLIKGV